MERHAVRWLAWCLLLLWVVPARAPAAGAESVTQLEARARANPRDIRTLFLVARAYSDQGDHSRALKILEDIIAMRRAPVVLFHLALAHARLGHLERAIILWLEIVQQHKPNSLVTLRYLGGALHKQGNYEESQRYWNRILELDPSNHKARYYLGVDLFRLGKARDAAKQLLILLKSRPPGEPMRRKALAYLGFSLVRLGALAKARKVFERLAALDPRGTVAQRALLKLRSDQAPEVPEDYDPRDVLKEAKELGDRPPEMYPPDQPPLPERISRVPGGIDSFGDRGRGGMSLQAEELFLDGLDQKEKGNYEKALYSFLQAIDVDPKFTQVYLQVGEIYIQLARLAPTRAQFNERLDLALGSLEKVELLAPGTLLAHAARGKIVLANRLKKEGFGAYHRAMAHTALAEKREQDAFEEYVLLLSNDVIFDEVFFELSQILPRLSTGNRQDLQYFLEDLSAKHPDQTMVPYLLGRTYLMGGKAQDARIALEGYRERLLKLEPRSPIVERMAELARRPRPLDLDLYLMGHYHFSRRATTSAEKLLRTYVEKAKKDALFYTEALRMLAQIQGEAPMAARGFEVERRELALGVPRAERLFEEDLDRGHADPPLLAQLVTFTQGRPENGAGRLALAWVLSVRAEKDGAPAAGSMIKQADETFLELLRDKASDPDWHIEAGVRLLHWGMEDRARAHLKMAGDILIGQGRTQSARHADRLLVVARRQIDRGRFGPSALLVRQAIVYDSESLSAHLVRSHLDRAMGKHVQAAWDLIECGKRALDLPWSRMLVLADLGILALTTALLVLFFLSLTLTFRHFEVLHHLFVEYLGHRGVMLTLTPQIFVGMLLVVAFPTAFVLYLPLLVWPVASRDERRVALICVIAVVCVPLALPVTMADSYALIRMVEEVRSGDLDAARKYLEGRLKADEGDEVARYLLGLAQLRQGDVESAARQFAQAYEKNAYDPAVLVNLGVVEARRGNLKRAAELFNQVLAHQAANWRALFDLGALHAFQGNHEKAQQYFKWARAASREPDQLARYQAFSSDSPRLALLDEPLDPARLRPYFHLLSTANLLSVNRWLGLFLAWLLLGGGLALYLVFLRERMDVVPMPCSLCLKVVCNLCSHAAHRKVLCPECAGGPSPEREKERLVVAQHAQAHKRRHAMTALAANLICPGSGLYFVGQVASGLLIQVLFVGAACLYASGGGWLLNAVHGPVTDPTLRILLWLSLTGACLIYLLGQAAFWIVKEDVV